jgi:hypothetical protein
MEGLGDLPEAGLRNVERHKEKTASEGLRVAFTRHSETCPHADGEMRIWKHGIALNFQFRNEGFVR